VSYTLAMLGKRKMPSTGGGERSERMHRVRVGLTGLAIVLIIVALATLVIAQFNRQLPPQSAATKAAEATKSSGDEPLADLGVAPGAPENAAK
jgi:hypothetical protein